MTALSFAFLVLISYPWPIRDFNTVHRVSAVLGDYRNTDGTYPRFHRGIDIPAPAGTPVFSITSGTAKWDGTSGENARVRVGDYWYIHLANRVREDSVVLGILDTTNTSPTRIGDVAALEHPHLHFQIGPYGPPEGPFYNPLSYNGGPVNYADTGMTIVYSIDSWRQGSETTAVQLQSPLSGKVDICARCQDRQTAGYSTPTATGGIYRWQWLARQIDGTLVYGPFQPYGFTQVQPPNNGEPVKYIYDVSRSVHANSDSFFYWTTNFVNADFQVEDRYWNTKLRAGEPWNGVDATTIDEAQFPDGKYRVWVMAYDIMGNGGDTLNRRGAEYQDVLVDNFHPRVKQTDPPNWFAFVPTKKHKVWCVFSEQMDTLTLTTANIKIKSLKADSFNYPITNITYIKDSFKLYLTVDSFRFKDTVQVQLLKGVKDLAGKSIQGSRSDTVAYSWTFVVGVIQLTDNDAWDLYPDVYHGKITWTQAPAGNRLGEIMLYDFYNKTTNQISPGGGIHTLPYIYQNEVAWIGYGWGYANPVYYYNGTTTQEIAPANKGRYSMEISKGGVAWRAYMWAGGWYDTIWVEYYDPISNQVYSLDTFLHYYGRYRGRTDIDGREVIWDGVDPTIPGYGTRELYRYCDGLTQNFSQDTVYDDATADVSNGQIFWLKDRGWSYLWFYDGVNERLIKDGSDLHSPYLHNGSMVWVKGVNLPGWWYVYYFDGRDTLQLMTRKSGYKNYAFQSLSIHNNQVGFLRLVYEKPDPPYTGYFGATLYDGNQVIALTVDTLGKGNSNRIEIHDGFVVYDAWDGEDYEIYLYLSDTLFTPPAVVKNLQGEVIGGKSSDKKIHSVRDKSLKRVRLTWKANTEPDLVGYKIYRSATAYQYGITPYATILAPETTFIDTLPLEGMNYYVATAYDNLNNEGGFSNQTSVFIDNIPPAAPANLVASYDSINQKVSLIWQKSADADLKLYKIYRSETSGNYALAIDSVFKPDTTFVDSIIFLGKTYYYVVSAVDTNKNESNFSNEDTAIIVSAIYSDFALATAYNNGRKILSSPGGDKVHFVYANEGWLVPAGVYYCYSSDSGRSFSSAKFVGGPGMYPALTIDPAGNPCASWVSGSNIAYTYWTSSWAPPDTIVLPVMNVSPPSMVVDKKDTVHLVFVQYRYLPSDIGDLIYLKFKRTNFSDAVSETLFTKRFCHTPSVLVDASRGVSLLWQGENCVCYWYKDSTGTWYNIDTIYMTTSNQRLFPIIDCYGNKITTVWQDKDAQGNLEIYSRRKTDIGWDVIKKISSTIGESRFPTLAGANYCLWQDNSLGNWEIYKSEYIDTLGSWSNPENISNSIKASAFAHCSYSLVNPTSAKLYCLWTEGDTIPYAIKFKKIDVSPVAKIFVDVGQPVQSSYCLQRDGFWIFGNLPYQTTDWGYEVLKYKLPDLDPEKEYRLDLAYYLKHKKKSSLEAEKSQVDDTEGTERKSSEITGLDEYGTEVRNPAASDKPDRPEKPDEPNRPTGIGRIIQVLIIDGMPLDTIFITPNKLVRRPVWLPQMVYKDGEIVIEIKKIKGKRVVCSEIGLYEFPPKGVYTSNFSGPQGDEAQIAKPFNFDRVYPNPAKGIIKLRFNSPDRRNVMIKIYDATGRLCECLKKLRAEKGMNEVLFVPRNLSSGVYFIQLEADNYKEVRKMVLIKE